MTTPGNESSGAGLLFEKVSRLVININYEGSEIDATADSRDNYQVFPHRLGLVLFCVGHGHESLAPRRMLALLAEQNLMNLLPGKMPPPQHTQNRHRALHEFRGKQSNSSLCGVPAKT